VISRKKAFSLDAVAEELLFVAGPVIIAAIIVATSPSIGLLVTVVVVLIGTIGLTTSAVSGAQHGTPTTAARSHGPLSQPGFTRVLFVLIAVGCILRAVEIVSPALAEKQNAVAASGWLLAAFAAGGAIGGLIYGHVRWTASLSTKMFILCLSMGTAALLVSQGQPTPAVRGGASLARLIPGPITYHRLHHR
jgi:hypothetical protein